MSKEALAFGCGLGTWSKSGVLLEAWFPVVIYKPSAKWVERLARELPDILQGSLRLGATELKYLAELLTEEDDKQAASFVQQLSKKSDQALAILLTGDDPIEETASAYLKLHLLSLRHAKPNQLNLDAIFSKLPNVAWTSEGAILPSEVPERVLQARLAGRHLSIHGIDKFPRMTDYVTVPNVRIADASRIRLGAHLGEGTTVMHEGFVNFNAGTLGSAMVEGRLSQGVTMGDGSDLGGSASTMGTLSGGGRENISIGRHCLIGANAGTGIPLGDNCVIEAGLYITAGTKVAVKNAKGELTVTVKARELAGQSNMLFIRNSENGRVECRSRDNHTEIKLNESLHAHN